MRGLYLGLTPQLVKVVPGASVSFAVYDKAREMLDTEIR